MIDQRHINLINRAIGKVQADGFTEDKGYTLTVGLDSIIIADNVRGDCHDDIFDYDKWEYDSIQSSWIRSIKEYENED